MKLVKLKLKASYKLSSANPHPSSARIYTYIRSTPDLLPSAIRSNSGSYVIALALLGNPCSMHYTSSTTVCQLINQLHLPQTMLQCR